MSLTANDIIALMETRGRGAPPSAIADIFVNPAVQILSFLDAKGDLANVKQTIDDIVYTLANTDEIESYATALNESIDTISAVLSRALEDIASNYGLTRRAAASSRGTVLLLRSSVPITNIQIVSGKRVFAPATNQEYKITETLTITPSMMTYNSDLGYFTYPVTVESVNEGLITVAAVGQIIKVRDGITGITGVTNTQPVVGGRDIESDANFADRIKTVLSSNNIGTKSGYRLLILSENDVKDATVVGAGDPLMVRDIGDGGAIDIYIANPIPVSVTETTSSTNVSSNTFYPSRQPIIDDVSTIVVSGFAPSSVTINKDISVYAGSIRARDNIVFDISIPIGTVTITYQVNDLVSREQVFIDDPTRKILGADLLIKEAILTPIDVIVRIATLSNYNSATIKTNVETVITQYLSTFNIGQSLEQSDIIRIITNVNGVDRVDLPLIKFDKEDNSGVQNIITAEANEALRPGVIEAQL